MYHVAYGHTYVACSVTVENRYYRNMSLTSSGIWAQALNKWYLCMHGSLEQPEPYMYAKGSGVIFVQ